MPDYEFLTPLGDLRWHWPCYLFSHPEPDVWIAQRSDTRKVLTAGDPETLRRLVRADYSACKVPRDIPPH
jgi:hypothetical protein